MYGNVHRVMIFIVTVHTVTIKIYAYATEGFCWSVARLKDIQFTKVFYVIGNYRLVYFVPKYLLKLMLFQNFQLIQSCLILRKRHKERSPGGSRIRERSPGGSRVRDRSPGVKARERSPPVGRGRERSPGGRLRDRSPHGRPRERSPFGRSRDRSPGAKPRDRSLGNRGRERSPNGRARDGQYRGLSRDRFRERDAGGMRMWDRGDRGDRGDRRSPSGRGRDRPMGRRRSRSPRFVSKLSIRI